MPAPVLTIEAPAEGSSVRGTVEVRAVADPERATHVVRFERSIAGGAWTPIGTDDSSPVYTVVRRPGAAGPGRRHADRVPGDAHRAGRHAVTSAVRTVRAAGPPLPTATLQYFRPAGDYGTELGPAHVGRRGRPGGARTDRLGQPVAATGVEGGWAGYEIPLVEHQSRSTSSCTCPPATACRTPANPAATDRSCRSTSRRLDRAGRPGRLHRTPNPLVPPRARRNRRFR